MEIYAVFGNPILHSRSPQLFNGVFGSMNINARYTRIRPINGTDLVNIILNHNIKGANVTTPYKEEVIGSLHSISDEVNEIHGVNTIININGKLVGHNTDHIGVVNSLIYSGIAITARKVLVLGAGPAAAAASYGLRNAGAKVFIANRTAHRAIEIGKRLNVNYIDFADITNNLSEFDIVVSALLPNANPFENVYIPKKLILLDANYRPSNLSNYFATYGCKVISGKHWLIHQAIASFKVFRSEIPKIEIMTAAVEDELDRNTVKVEWLQRVEKGKALGNYDLLISASNENVYKQFLDEEIDKAFGG
jgi:shikimate dehydrogenase